MFYDLDGRLLSASGPWGNELYRYDALDNLRKRTLPPRIVNIGYSAAKNQVSSVSDTGKPTRTFSHDSRGNVTNDGRYTFTYDRNNQPTSLSGSGVSASHTYDGTKKRVKSVVDGSTTYYVYSALDGTIILKDESTANKVSEYASAGPLGIRLVNGSPTYVHQNHLGSPVAATNTSGGLLWRETYMPFGETMLSPAGNDDDRGFTGHIADSATGLVYMQARYYDPVIGRFLQTDPVGYADQMNLYAYVANDPINAYDPDGRKLRFKKGSTPAFKKQFAEIIQYHNRNKTSATFARLESRPEVVTIAEGAENEFRTDLETKTIIFDPTSGLEISPGKVQTPALGVLHETAHVEASLIDPVAEEIDYRTPNEAYDNEAERKVIENVETPAVKKIGEPTRTNHGGDAHPVSCPTCNK